MLLETSGNVKYMRNFLQQTLKTGKESLSVCGSSFCNQAFHNFTFHFSFIGGT